MSIIVETTPPTSSCTAPAYENHPPITVNWSAADTETGVWFTYLYVNGPGDAAFAYTGLYSAGTGGTFDYTPSAGNGLYQFAVRSVDNGGNWEAVPTVAEDETFYDTVTPSSSLSSPPYDAGGSISIDYSASDPAPSSGIAWVDFWYKYGATGVWTYTGQFSSSPTGTVSFTPVTGDGVYYFASRAKDNAQNLESYPPDRDDSTIYDTIAPIGSISINGGAASTASLIVTLNLNAGDATSGVSLMQFSNDNSTWSPWEAYQSTRNGWDLSSYGGSSAPGTKSAFVRFRDYAGHVSSSYSDTIVYAVSAPCENDFDADRDVDGRDLAKFAGSFDAGLMVSFAADFGRVDCP